MAIPGVSSRPGPAAEAIPPVPLPPCDATASGSENGQVQLTRDIRVLTLCAHHAAEYGLALVAAGWHVTRDDRAWRPSCIVSCNEMLSAIESGLTERSGHIGTGQAQ